MLRRHRKVADIQIVPYVDVMLVLVVILAISCAGFLPSVIQLPAVAQKNLAQKSQQATVWVKKDGGLLFSFNKQTPQTASLEDIVAQLQQKNVQVLLAGDKDVAYHYIISTMASLKKANIAQVSLLVKAS